jgi:hypothetical protein
MISLAELAMRGGGVTRIATVSSIFAVCPGNSCMPATQQSPQAPGINGRKACD